MATRETWPGRRRLEQAVRRALQLRLDVLGEEIPPDASTAEILRILRGAADSPIWAQWAHEVAALMVTEIAHASGRNWREAVARMRPGREMHAAIQQELRAGLGSVFTPLVRANAEYIRSVPRDVAREFTEHIATQAMAGKRAATIAQELRDLYPHISRVKAQLIARTESAKTHTALEQARSERLGVRWYRWMTSHDERVRKSHRNMYHVLVAWDDPPSPEELVGERNYGHYPAGGTWNCRCGTYGVLGLDDVTWPARVYTGGQIVTMRRATFEAQLWEAPLAARARLREVV